MPVRLLAITATLGSVGGGVFGFVRGLHYLPTLPFAIIEGGILFGVPLTIAGLLTVGVWSLGSLVRRRTS